MSGYAAQAAKFYKEVAESGIMWTVRDDLGFPAPKTSSGQRSMPFWSSKSRVEKIISNVPAYAGFRPEKVTYNKFIHYWVDELSRARQLVGVNWSGNRATGFDLKPERVEKYIESERRNQSSV
ncbi:MAG: DUF2750 domain-containing protein [Pseudomonadota bacterium]